MKITTLVAAHIAEVVHGNWTDIYLDDVTADVTYMEAIALPAGVSNSIAALLHHISLYNNIVLERLNGNDPTVDAANGLDVSVNSEDEWRQLKAAAFNSFKKLAAFVAGMPDEKLWEYGPGGHNTFYKTLHGIAEHAHYHMGQVVLLKKIIRAAGK